ncbi:MAG: hypothetical protein HYX75_13570 [Acidobacteria bacterium]|nr:hypothetical protein [Acidobacteriota bacterium]
MTVCSAMNARMPNRYGELMAWLRIIPQWAEDSPVCPARREELAWRNGPIESIHSG